MFDGHMTEAIQMNDDLESLIPIRDQVLLRPDCRKQTTKQGIILPESSQSPVFRATVLAVSFFVEKQWEALDVPELHRLACGDRVVFHWNSAMPQHYGENVSPVLVSINNILAKVRRDKRDVKSRTEKPIGVT